MATGYEGICKGYNNNVRTEKAQDSSVDLGDDVSKKPVLKPKAEAPAPTVDAPAKAPAEAPEADIAPAVEGLNDDDAAKVEAVSDAAEAKADDATEADAEAASADKA